jgi:hypothetical protein
VFPASIEPLERQQLADYTNHFAQVVESLAGRLFQVEGDANRRIMNDQAFGFGDPLAIDL